LETKTNKILKKGEVLASASSNSQQVTLFRLPYRRNSSKMLFTKTLKKG
jgi:hypothetical protein